MSPHTLDAIRAKPLAESAQAFPQSEPVKSIKHMLLKAVVK